MVISHTVDGHRVPADIWDLPIPTKRQKLTLAKIQRILLPRLAELTASAFWRPALQPVDLISQRFLRAR